MHNAAHYRLVLLSYLVDSVLIPWGWDNSFLVGREMQGRCAVRVGLSRGLVSTAFADEQRHASVPVWPPAPTAAFWHNAGLGLLAGLILPVWDSTNRVLSTFQVLHYPLTTRPLYRQCECGRAV
jgi:hypothetical protein